MNNEELMHYGVLGMKWGVRKDRYKDDYDRDTIIKKGQKINVITAGQKANTNRNYTYASRTNHDKNFYESHMPDLLKKTTGTATKIYQNDFTVKKNIKIPSQETAVNTFLKMYRDDPNGVTSAIATSLAARKRTADMGRIKNLILDKQEKKLYSVVYKNFYRQAKVGEEWLKNEGYEAFNTSFAYVKNPARDRYFELLLKQGFGGVRDVNDLNSGLTEDPLIVFNPSSNLSNLKSHELTENDILLAKAKYDYDKSNA